MTVWPNWIDLIIVTTIWIIGYNGFGRGLLAELLNLIGAVSVTAVTVNYSSVVTSWLLRLPLWFSPSVSAVSAFWGLFLSVWWGVRLVLKRVANVIKWERFHWLFQGGGLVLGGLRGLWWSGFILLVFSSTGVPFLRASVEERSVLGPRVLHVFRTSLERVTDRFPGAQHRSVDLIPHVQPTGAAR